MWVQEKKEAGFGTWAIVELMGHVRIAGYLTEEERFGVKMGRLDIPAPGGDVTQYFGGSSVYRITPVTEEVARAFAEGEQPKPVQTWQLPAALRERVATVDGPDLPPRWDDEGYPEDSW